MQLVRSTDSSAVPEIRPDGFRVVADYLTWARARGWSEDSLRSYRPAVLRFLAETVGDHPAEATADHVAAFLRETGKNGPQGRRQALKALKSFYGWAVAKGITDHDPAAHFAIRKPRVSNVVALNEEELTRLIFAAAVRDQRRGYALLLTFALGARRAEVASIEPRDDHGDRVHLRVTKFGKPRFVEVNALARAAIDGLRPWWNGTLLGGIEPATVTKWAVQAATDAGLREKVRGRPAHVLRASFISHMLRRGVPIQVVRDLAGHADLTSTNLYSAVFDADRRSGVEALEHLS
jgi:site-specific recombinase XerD